MIKNRKVSDLIETIKNENLNNMIMEYVKEKSLDEDSGCIQLLICKTSPFVQQMQEAVVSKRKVKGYKAFFEYLPNFEEIVSNGDDCEQKHPYCTIFL